MKTSVEDISPVKKRLLVEIGADEVNKSMNRAYGEIRKRAKIPGFRPGKVPRKILESYFGGQVADDVTRELIGDSFPKAVDEVKAFPLGQPMLEKEPLKQGESFKYSAIMEVRPEFEVNDYTGVPVEKEKLSVTEKDVDDRLQEIRESSGKLESIEEDRPIQDDDFAVIEYEGFENGEPIEGVKSSNQLIRVGKNDFHPTFDEALIGAKKGDNPEIHVDFEADHYHAKLAGKSVTFKTHIVDIKELKLPDLTDEFAKGLGADFEDLEGLKAEIRKNLTTQEEERVDRELKGRLLEKISEGVKIELPQVLVDAELQSSLERFKNSLKMRGSSLEATGISEDNLAEEIRPASEKRVKEMLILGQIARQVEIALTDEDLEDGYRKLAERTGQDIDTLKKVYEARSQVDSLKDHLLEEKTLNYLVEHAKISEKEKGELSQEKPTEEVENR
ncbi:MAG: trigger factor [Deltaproteobacteria bacterium]|nr:trigger factor [Deltaproteobacteria bacterium]